jgi:hypothetical protein
MLLAPMIVGLAVGRPPVVPSLLLAAAAISLFLAREPASLLFKVHARKGQAGWLAAYLTIFVVSSATLLIQYNALRLALFGLTAALLFLTALALRAAPSRKRLDRTVAGELLSAAALALTAPSAAALGGANAVAQAAVWLVCAAYYSGGILFVKMLLAALKHKGPKTRRTRLHIGASSLTYHAAMLLGAGIAALGLGGWQATLLVAAFLPAIIRAVWGWRFWLDQPPPFKRVGILEAIYSVWFTVAVSLALSRLA